MNKFIKEILYLAGCNTDYQEYIEENIRGEYKYGTPTSTTYNYKDASKMISNDYIARKNKIFKESHYSTNLSYIENLGYNNGKKYDIHLVMGINDTEARNNEIQVFANGYGFAHVISSHIHDFYRYYKDIKNIDLKYEEIYCKILLTLEDALNSNKYQIYHAINTYGSNVCIKYDGIYFVLVLKNNMRNDDTYILTIFPETTENKHEKEYKEKLEKQNDYFLNAIHNGYFQCYGDANKFKDGLLKPKYLNNKKLAKTPLFNIKQPVYTKEQKIDLLCKLGGINKEFLDSNKYHWNKDFTIYYSSDDLFDKPHYVSKKVSHFMSKIKMLY